MAFRCIKFLTAALSVLLYVSCSEPTVYEDFVKVSSRDASGRYAFRLDMSDSTASYDISFYTRIEGAKMESSALRSIPVNVLLVSPEGKHFSETVYIGNDSCTESSHYHRVYFSLYRKDSVPYSYGLWNMFLSVPQEVEGICGMGVKLERKSELHGKR